MPTADEIELIRSYDKFYHVTDIENIHSILQHGLRMGKLETQDDTLVDIICLCPRSKLNETCKATFQWRQNAIFEISASNLIGLNFGLDITFDDQCSFQTRFESPESLKHYIDFYGTLAVYEPIPPEYLILIPPGCFPI